MKLHLLMPVLCLCITQFSNAQSWVNSDNRWHIQINCIGTFNGFEVHAFFFRDTLLLNGKVYRQMYETLDSTFENAEPTGYWYREEMGEVYIFEPSTTNPERLIYDFNLEIGDTLTIKDEFSGVPIEVVSVDSITLMDGSKRKRLTIENKTPFPIGNKTATWIEGIGSDIATLDTKNMFISDCQEGLNCFYIKNEWVYQRLFQSCKLTRGNVSTRNIQELKNLKVFPNPFTTELYLEATLLDDFKVKDDYTVAIFDAQGKQLYHNQVTWVNKLRINTSTWHRGLYFLVIRSANGVLSRKLIKI